jgi:pilus assembly protein CpaC
MDVKKLVGRGVMGALLVLATGASAGPTKTAPARKETPASPQVLSLKAGASRTLRLAEVSRLALKDPEIADVSVTGAHGIQIKGLKKGETLLRVWLNDGKTHKDYKLLVGG